MKVTLLLAALKILVIYRALRGAASVKAHWACPEGEYDGTQLTLTGLRDGVSKDKLVLQEGEAELLERLQTLAPQYRTRPSALLPLIRATGTALGALSAVLPRPYSEAIKGVPPCFLRTLASCSSCGFRTCHLSLLSTFLLSVA